MADLTTDVGKVRLLIPDLDEELFTDDEIQAFLDLEGSEVRMAAAQAIETIASSKGFLAKRKKLGDYEIEEWSPSELMKRAAKLREQSGSGSLSVGEIGASDDLLNSSSGAEGVV